MQVKHLLTALLLCSTVSGYGQKPYYNQTPEFLKANGVWALYNSLGLNFNDRANFQFSTSIPKGAQTEGCASVSDPKTGKLLFYSDGENCWNRNNKIMPNGSGLLGNGTYHSTTQGVCIVPFVNDSEKYYLFSLSSTTLPSSPDSIYSKVMDTLICSGWENGITLKPRLTTDDYVYEWSNGSTDTILKVTDSGTYWITFNNGCHYRVDTFVLHGSDLNPVININKFDLSTTESYLTYQWLLNGNLIPGATDSVYTVTQNGNYQVIVSDGICTDTSEIYKVTNYTIIEPVSRIAQQIKILPNPANDKVYIQSPAPVNVILTNMEGRALRQQADAKMINVSNLSAGIYLLQITDSDNRPVKKDKLVILR